MSNEFLIFSNLQIHSEQGILHDACVVVHDRIIHKVITHAEIQNFPSARILDFPKHYHLIPGFIDLHVHGANGSDVMDANADALSNISQTLAREGTTSFLATTMTETPEKIADVLCSVSDFMRTHSGSGSTILGVHLEGPFLSAKKVGAQRSDTILPPKIEYIEHWQKIANNIIKLVTLAPELPNSLEFIEYLKEKNIIASIGHTDASYSETINAINAGCTHATHLFNAMRGIHHREPGAVTAALLSNQVMAELIIDGIHLHPAVIQLVLQLKGKDRIILVTDSMRAKCLCDGLYDLGGQPVIVKENQAKLSDGTLAGSLLKMNSAVQNLLQFSNCSLSEAIQMASANPAKSLGIFAQKGSIAANKDADLVVLDEKLNVVLTLCEGKVVFESKQIIVTE